MQDYSVYRLTTWEWIQTYKDRMGAEAFYEYRDLLYKTFMDMKAGDAIDLETMVKTENQELFIKIACMFITENHPNYDFTDDYRFFRCRQKETVDTRRNPIPQRKSQYNPNVRPGSDIGTNRTGS